MKISATHYFCVMVLLAGGLFLASCTSQPRDSVSEAMPEAPSLAAGAIEDGPPSGTGVLDGTLWTITRLSGADVPQENAPTLAFQDRGVTGSTGCNRYFGQVSVSEVGIVFATMGVSRRACAPRIMNLETDFLEALGRVDGYALHGDDRLVLSSGLDVQIEARREP